MKKQAGNKKQKVSSLGYYNVQKADKLRLHSLFKESIKYYLKCIMIERDNRRAYIGLAMAYKQLKDYERAIQTLLKARGIYNEDADIEYELGICHILSGYPCRAVMHLRNAIMLDNRNINAQIQLALAHEMLDEPEIALGIYQAVIERHPGYAGAYNHLASLYMNFEDYESAAGVFNALLKVNPKLPGGYLGIGSCFEKLGRKASALRYYRRYLELEPESIDAKRLYEKISKLKNSDEAPSLRLRLV